MAMELETFVIATNVDDEVQQAQPTQPCGCPQGEPCTCGPRLRIFDPMGRLLLSPVYY